MCAVVMWPLVGSRNWMPIDQERWCNEAKMRRLCVTLFHPKSPSIRLKFGNRSGTAVVYVISLIWPHSCVTWCIILRMLGTPVIVVSHFIWLHSPCFIYHHITLPKSLLPPSASLNSTGICVYLMYAVSFHQSPPPTGGVRDQPRHRQMTVLLQSFKEALDLETMLF